MLCYDGVPAHLTHIAQAPIPKQYLELRGHPIATYSLRTFASMPEVGEIVVVCEPEYDEVFTSAHAALDGAPPLVFARPGKERQDSVYNGLQVRVGACTSMYQHVPAYNSPQAARPDASLVAIHDSARPMMAAEDVRKCIADALQVGAAVLGVPVKPTIKEVAPDGSVVATLQRSKLWEVQTPQVIRPGLLQEGFALVREQGLEVTDDVSIVEALGKPVRVTPGSYTNIKVTTPDDLLVAEKFISQQQTPAAVVSSA